MKQADDDAALLSDRRGEKFPESQKGFRYARPQIEHILKSWLPNVTILEPEEFRKKFLNDLLIGQRKVSGGG